MPDYRRAARKEGHPLASMFDDIDVKRTKEDLDSIFDFSDSPLERDDIDVHPGRGAGVVEPDGYLDGEEFDAYTEAAKESEKLGWDPMAKENYAKSNKLSTPEPLQAHLSRGDEVAQNDVNRKAKVTTDPVKYANAPSRYDFPFVDAPSRFREKFKDTSWNKLEEKAGRDEIFEW